ncbi:ZIP family metal transporter [Candidatus Falkowbacteria bacterium]|nr:ZIP family metal transporter [Candidatus Falkowbacteria bacterium]
MFQTQLYTIISVLVVGFISLIGIITLALKVDRLKKILFFLVAFSAGALLGDVFIHIIPEISKNTGITFNISIYFLSGLIGFFILEKFLAWRHCHDLDCKENAHHRLATMNLVGDGFHNFIDGMLIAGSYLVSVPLGITTTIAVIAHEIPQELGDFGILIHSGYTPRRAVFYNFISALIAVLGALFILAVNSSIENLTQILLPFTAGGFIYIAGSGIIPELHKEVHPRKSLVQLLGIILGIVIMSLLLFIKA